MADTARQEDRLRTRALCAANLSKFPLNKKHRRAEKLLSVKPFVTPLQHRAGRGSEALTVDIEHHVPHGWAYRLMKTKPHFAAPTEGVIVSLRRGEEGTAHRCVPAQANGESAQRGRPRPVRGRMQSGV